MTDLSPLEYMALPKRAAAISAPPDPDEVFARRWAAGAADRHVMETVRRLPDAMFADHPEIVSLSAEVATWQRRSKLPSVTDRGRLEQAIADLVTQLAKVDESLRFAALDDAAEGDFEFPRALEASERAELLRRRLGAARLVREEINKPVFANGVQGRYAEEIACAQTRLRDALFRLKSEHVSAHPELLERPVQ